MALSLAAAAAVVAACGESQDNACRAEDDGVRRCQDTRVEACDGEAWGEVVDCAATGEICLAAEGTAACVPEPCAPEGGGRCQGAVLERCDRGSWRTIADCEAEDKVCRPLEDDPDRADCVLAETCTQAGQTRCRGAVLESCDGSAWTTLEECIVCRVVADEAQCVLGEICLAPGTQRCQGSVLEECTENMYLPQIDCAQDGKICQLVPGFEYVAMCTAPTFAAELDPCAGGGCAEGLVCVAANNTTASRCYRSCDPGQSDACGQGWSCQAAEEAAGGGVCQRADGQRDAPCGDNGVACAEAAGVCTKTESDPVAHHCKLECESVDIGTRGGCPQGELCLSSGFFFSQSPLQTCSHPGEAGVCDEAAGYRCDTVSGVTKCIRYVGWCGIATPMLGGFADEDVNAYAVDGHYCEKTDDHRMCAVSGATEPAADVKCKYLGEHAGRKVYACVGFCAPDDASDPDLDCGDGYVCGRPSHDDARYYAIAEDASGADITCTAGSDAGCDVDNDYRCHGPFGDDYKCATPSKVCLTEP